jgi:hypothetical protein
VAQQTVFRPTIVAGVRQTRSFTRGFGNFPFRYRTALQVYNKSAATIILYVNGEEVRRVAAGDLGIFDEDMKIEYYEVDASANTGANEVEILEDGGLDESLEQQLGLARSAGVEV